MCVPSGKKRWTRLLYCRRKLAESGSLARGMHPCHWKTWRLCIRTYVCARVLLSAASFFPPGAVFSELFSSSSLRTIHFIRRSAGRPVSLSIDPGERADGCMHGSVGRPGRERQTKLSWAFSARGERSHKYYYVHYSLSSCARKSYFVGNYHSV